MLEKGSHRPYQSEYKITISNYANALLLVLSALHPVRMVNAYY